MKKLSLVVSAVALVVSAVSFSSMAVTQGPLTNNTIAKFETQVAAVCGFSFDNKYAELGINGEWSGEQVTLRAYNNTLTGIGLDAIPTNFPVDIEAFGLNGINPTIVETMMISVQGPDVVSQGNYMATHQGVQSFTTMSDREIRIKAKTSLSEHQIPADVLFGLGMKVTQNCF